MDRCVDGADRGLRWRGGTVILGGRTGSRDVNNHVIRDTSPGKTLSALAGITVEEFGLLTAPGNDGLFPLNGPFGFPAARQRLPAESALRTYMLKIGNHEVAAAHMYELLNLESGTTELGSWSNRFAAGRAAVTSRKVGRGRVLYVGTYLTPDLVEALVSQIFAQAGVEPLLPNVPAGVEVTVREAKEKKLMFILNTRHDSATIAGIPPGAVLVSDASLIDGSLKLPGYGCAILKMVS